MRMTRAIQTTNDFPGAMKIARKSRRLSQESFALVSSRTYVGSLERGLYSPTLNKLDELATYMDMHPLALIALAYLTEPTIGDMEFLLERVQKDLARIVVKR